MAGLLEQLLEISDPGEDRRDLLEMQVRHLREQPRDGGLAGSRRPPENEGAKRARLDHAGEHTIRPHQMILPHHVCDVPWPQAVRQGARRALLHSRSLEQTGHAAPRPARLNRPEWP